MKNKLTAALCVFMCVVLAFSTFVACSVKNRGSGDGTDASSLAPDESWGPGFEYVYQPVELSPVELADLVSEALGKDAKNFKGDINALTPEQTRTIEKVAREKGLIVDKDDDGKIVVKKEKPVVTRVSKEEYDRIIDRASVKNPSNISDEEFAEISKIADNRGATVITRPNDGGVDIVKPVTRPVQPPRRPSTKPPAPTDKPVPSSGKPPVKTTAPAKPTKVTRPDKTTAPAKPTEPYKPPAYSVPRDPDKLPQFSSDWVKTAGGSDNDIFSDNATTSDGGVVSVGATFSPEDRSPGSKDVGAIIVKHDVKGKELWKKIVDGDEMTAFESVTVLKNGSIIAVGYTAATNIVGDAEYKCKNTIEGLMVKFSADGNELWRKLIGGSADDSIRSVQASPDGGFVIGGNSTSNDADMKDLGSKKIKAFVFKCSPEGDIQWKNALSGSKHNGVEDMAVASSGDTYVTILCITGDGEYSDIEGTKTGRRCSVVLKISSVGKIIWKKAIYENGAVELKNIALSNDGGCVVAGHYASKSDGNMYSFKGVYNGGNPGTLDGMIVKLDAAGITRWIRPLIGFENDYITGIAGIKGGYVVCGYTKSSNRNFPFPNKGDHDSFIYTIGDDSRIGTFCTFAGGKSDNARAVCSNGESVYVSGSTNSSDLFFEKCEPKASENACAAFVCRFNIKK